MFPSWKASFYGLVSHPHNKHCDACSKNELPTANSVVFFTHQAKLAIMSILASEALLRENKKFLWVFNLGPLGSPFWANLAFACKLILFSSKSKNLSSTYQVDPESRVLDLESEAWVLSSLGVTFCHWNFLFLHNKASDANIGIIAYVVCL